MSREMQTKYNSRETEGKWYNIWTEKGYFHADPTLRGKPFTIVIPPPNITGILHMGHALNNTIQDTLVRWKRMQGKNTLWMPGTDHAGIATQNVVERKLKREGRSREQLGRQKFLQEVWRWREEYGHTIINQLKRMGCSCDWARTRFTMDQGLSDAVVEAFVRLYEKGLIYRGNYIINWCPRCRTALSDEESEHKELKGFLYYIKYPVKGGGHVTVATTRPETMLGDTAVAVNPRDGRYKKLHGRKVVLPIQEREIPVIVDDYVDPEFGTGIVKITPGHDPNDFVIGQKHKLPVINVMNDDATMSGEAGPYQGQDRFECREALLVDLKERGLLEKTETHPLSVGHCYRCHTIIEPRVSRQWFVRMKPLAKKAIAVVEKGDIKFMPERWTKVYREWMYNIRDWCISRQIWWGHRIPVWYCRDCQNKDDNRGLEKGIIVSRKRPDKCPSCGNTNLEQDPDVLDTWFSSWLWPFSTMGWPRKTAELKLYYPTDVLVTAQEIIFFWVARMIMAGLAFTGKIPFNTVYIHGTVRDETGTKMSKSLGNVIDPLEIIDEVGADALRFSLIAITAQGQDVFLSRHQFESGRNFTNKIWNASRFLLLNLEGSNSRGNMPPPLGQWSGDDWFIIGKLQETVKRMTSSLEQYRFKEAAQAIYDFFWHEFCDKYIEAVKPDLYGDDVKTKGDKKKILFYVLETSLRLLHPIMPFITEEIWQKLKQIAGLKEESIMLVPWPRYKKNFYRTGVIKQAAEKFELIRAGRVLRNDYGVPPSARIDFSIRPKSKSEEKYLIGDRASLVRLLGAREVAISIKFKSGRLLPAGVTPAGTIYISLEGVDTGKEAARIRKELANLQNDLDLVSKKLANKEFCSRAPRQVVEKARSRREGITEKQEKLKKHLEYFTEGKEI